MIYEFKFVVLDAHFPETNSFFYDRDPVLGRDTLCYFEQ